MGSDSKKRAVGVRDYMPFGPIEDLGLTLDHKKVLVDELEHTIHAGMQAMKTQRLAYKGKVVETHNDVDHMARLRSAELAAQVTGLRTMTKDPKVIVQANIITPSWALQRSPKQKIIEEGMAMTNLNGNPQPKKRGKD